MKINRSLNMGNYRAEKDNNYFLSLTQILQIIRNL